MSVYFTSDLHIGHKKVAGIRAAQSMITTYMSGISPEVDAQKAAHEISWHDRTLALYWDDMVKPEDQVWILGDISAGGDRAQKDALAWLRERPGHKHLIAGNHDGAHSMHRDAHRWQVRYLEHWGKHQSFESVQTFARRRVLLEPEGHTDVVLSHFPYEADHGVGTRYPEWRLKDFGVALIHGHTHSTEKVSHSAAGTLQINVSPDAWDMKPVPWDTLVEIVRKEGKQ